MSLTFRNYKSGDEHRILDLFKQVFGKEMSLSFWRWRFADNPFGKAIIKLSFDGDTLIGHYAVIPMEVQVQGKLTKAAFSMTTMVHQDYRDSQIFVRLARETYKAAAETGAQFVYAFPNGNSYFPFVKMLGWRGLGTVSILEKPVKNEGIGRASGFNIKRIERFDSSIDLLWEGLKPKYPVIVPRNSQFLNWRFVQNPDINYAKYVFANDGELSGYIVLKRYSAPDRKVGHIVDMLATENDEVISGLIDSAYRHFAVQGIDVISGWFPDNTVYARILGGAGFTRKDMEDTYFGVKILDKPGDSNTVINHLPNWFLSMGDSDVF